MFADPEVNNLFSNHRLGISELILQLMTNLHDVHLKIDASMYYYRNFNFLSSPIIRTNVQRDLIVNINCFVVRPNLSESNRKYRPEAKMSNFRDEAVDQVGVHYTYLYAVCNICIEYVMCIVLLTDTRMDASDFIFFSFLLG